MKLPETPFTMSEFRESNNLGFLSRDHFRVIHKRFNELGLVRIRKHRGKGFAEDVWVPAAEAPPVEDLARQLKTLRIK